MKKCSFLYLVADIDAGASVHENGDSGLVPIGNKTIPFKGTIHGGGYDIHNLTIHKESREYIIFVYIC